MIQGEYFILHLEGDNIARLRMSWYDLQTLRDAFFSALTNKNIDMDVRMNITAAISDAMIAVMEENNQFVGKIAEKIKDPLGDAEDL